MKQYIRKKKKNTKNTFVSSVVVVVVVYIFKGPVWAAVTAVAVVTINKKKREWMWFQAVGWAF